MNEKNDFAVVPQPPSTVEKAASGAKRILSGMVMETLVLAKKTPDAEAWFQKGKSCHKEQNYLEAIKWYRMAAEQEHPEAQWNLGNFFDSRYHGMTNLATGRLDRYWDSDTGCFIVPPVQQDDFEAMKWYRKAAEQCNTEAQNSMDQCSDNDYARRGKFYSKLGAQELGYCYLEGRGVPHDYNEAIRWFKKMVAGEIVSGNMAEYAMLGISRCYQKLGDLVESFKCLMLANDSGLREEELNSLRPLLTKKQIAEAERRYHEFQSSKSIG